jgi:hypothetical protein
MRIAFLAATALAFAEPAAAVEIRVGLPALERLVTTALLKDGGRLYLEGRSAEACRYAFIQEPKLASDGPRLVARFVFAGRAGVSVGGRCVGPADSTTLSVSGVPSFEAGDLYLADLALEAPGSAYYKAVGGLLQGQLAKRLRLPLRAMVERSLSESGASGLTFALKRLEVRDIVVEPQAVRINLEGALGAQ